MNLSFVTDKYFYFYINIYLCIMLKFILGFCLGYWVSFNKDVVKEYINKGIEWVKSLNKTDENTTEE